MDVHVGQNGHPDIEEGDVVARVARRRAQVALRCVGSQPETEAVLSAEIAYANQRVRAVVHEECARSNELVHGAVASPARDPIRHLLRWHYGAIIRRYGDGVRPPGSGHGVPPILFGCTVRSIDGSARVE